MISKIDVIKKILHFHAPFAIAYEKVDTAEIIVLKLTSKNGALGLGSAAPDHEVTGETVDQVYGVLKKNLVKGFFDLPLDFIYAYHEKIQRVFKNYPSAAHAVEEALLNIFCTTHHISLVNIFGGYRSHCNLSITVGIKDKKETIAEVAQRVKEGYTMIKLKVGLDVIADLDRIQSCLKKFPSNVHFMVDANQGYSSKDAIKLCKNLPQKGEIAFIEQPVDAKKIGQLKGLKAHTSIPIIADEAVVTFEDAFYLLTNNIVDGINIKLMKCGGPINFMKLFHLAKSLNKMIIIGCMYESNISITTGTALALALPVDFADLDSGPVDFYDDIVSGGAIIKHGQLSIGAPLALHL